MSVNDQTKVGGGQRLSQAGAKIKEGVTTVYHAVLGHECDNCAKTASKRIEDQYFCRDSCYHEFNRKLGACGQGHPLCCLPGCQKPCFYEHGRYREFCGRSHGQMFKQEHVTTQLYVIMRTQGGGHFQVHSGTSSAQRAAGHYPHGRAEWAHPSTYHQSNASAGASHTHMLPWATNQPILFYHSWQPYYEFTNFSTYPIFLQGKWWPTSEHFFQAQKFIGTPLVDAIRCCNTPREAFDISRSELGTKWLRKDWSEEKLNVMKLALRAKFTQHWSLYKSLLSTGDRQLVEHTSRDNFWGDGGDGSGQNKLGKMLVELRQELRQNKLKTDFHRSSSWGATCGTFQDVSRSPHLSSDQPTTSSQNAHETMDCN